MDPEKKKRLAATDWTVGIVRKFLQLTEEDMAVVATDGMTVEEAMNVYGRAAGPKRNQRRSSCASAGPVKTARTSSRGSSNT